MDTRDRVDGQRSTIARRSRLGAAFVLASLAVALHPAEAASQEAELEVDRPRPISRDEQQFRRTGLIVGGAIVFGGTHILSAVIAGTAGNFGNKGGWMAVPLIGPWGLLAARDYCRSGTGFDASACEAGDVALAIVTTMSGLMQLAGASMMIVGLTLSVPRAHVGVTMTPTFVPAGRGSWVPGITGTF